MSGLCPVLALYFADVLPVFVWDPVPGFYLTSPGPPDKTENTLYGHMKLIFCRIGPRYYMSVVGIGCALNILSVLAFAYFRNYYILVAARIPQGIGAAFTIVGGKIVVAMQLY